MSRRSSRVAPLDTGIKLSGSIPSVCPPALCCCVRLPGARRSCTRRSQGSMIPRAPDEHRLGSRPPLCIKLPGDQNHRGAAHGHSARGICRVAGPSAIVGCAPTECSRRGFGSNAEGHGAAGYGFEGHGGLFAGERRFPHCEAHACRRAQTPPCLSHRAHRDVHGGASEPADRARVSADRAAGARCRACS